MNFGPILFLGIFITFALSWIIMVFMPSVTLSKIKATQVEGTTIANPAPYTGEQALGRLIYRRDGCVYCHTQQVRGGDFNNDLARGWGSRRSNPQDYIYDYPLLLGTERNGPDLANVGARLSNDNWHYTHFYDPQLITQGSIMAPFRFLFILKKIGDQPSPDGLKFNFVYVTISGDTQKVLADLKKAGFNLVEPRGGRYVGGFDPAKIADLAKIPGVTLAEPYIPPGYEIIPTDDAKHLVAYVKSLDHTYDIPPASAYTQGATK